MSDDLKIMLVKVIGSVKSFMGSYMTVNRGIYLFVEKHRRENSGQKGTTNWDAFTSASTTMMEVERLKWILWRTNGGRP